MDGLKKDSARGNYCSWPGLQLTPGGAFWLAMRVTVVEVRVILPSF